MNKVKYYLGVMVIALTSCFTPLREFPYEADEELKGGTVQFHRVDGCSLVEFKATELQEAIPTIRRQADGSLDTTFNQTAVVLRETNFVQVSPGTEKRKGEAWVSRPGEGEQYSQMRTTTTRFLTPLPGDSGSFPENTRNNSETTTTFVEISRANNERNENNGTYRMMARACGLFPSTRSTAPELKN